MRAELLIRKRICKLMIALVVLFGTVLVRIVSLTVIQGEELTARGVRQWTREGKVEARRGDIVDCNGETLALSTTAYIVSADPKRVSDEEAFADTVSQLLNMDRAAILKRLQNKNYASVQLKRQAPRETVDQIRALCARDEKAAQLLRGISYAEDTRRVYIKGRFLSQVLGLTNVDSVGQSGLERQYETLLAGADGTLLTEVDRKAKMLPDGKTSYVAPVPGNTLRLTVDAAIQSFADRAMRECIAVNNAKSVACIVMDVNSGGILAMSMKPDYDPNEPPRSDIETLNELMRITLISDAYEPGSTFKALTCAAALDAKLVAVGEHFHCSGSVKVDGDTIRCWKNSHGSQTLAEGLQNSCNPVFVNLALRLGTQRMYQYMRAFGLGVSTGIDLPGENAGILINSRYVKNVDLARIGFGQSVAVTPIQLITAFSAVINGGKLMQPHIVEAVLDEKGETVQRTAAQVVSTPISAETSQTMRTLLEKVVSEGGGKNAYIEGYRVGGKTGTAQVYVDGKVSRDVHIGSFIGFAPADHPRFAVLVIVNAADVPVDYGGTTAAPFARMVIEDTLQYLGYKKEGEGEQKTVSVPSLAGMTVQEAQRLLRSLQLNAETDGVSDTVTSQMPAAGASLHTGGQVMLYTAEINAATPETMACVPDVLGRSVVEASRILRARGFELKLEGSGIAVKQSPAAGAYAPAGSSVTVTFSVPKQEGL
ncbi:MAG: PASTA domain-containing protein [Clostridia bacterium]|nr:PASTA domain-containing protein [Clostridia bacterium]